LQRLVKLFQALIPLVFLQKAGKRLKDPARVQPFHPLPARIDPGAFKTRYMQEIYMRDLTLIKNLMRDEQ